MFQLHSSFQPSGDQPEAIKTLSGFIQAGNQYQTLIGVTGSGKTFSMAHIIESLQIPTLIMTHNKTLAAQLYSEFKGFSQKTMWNTSFRTLIIINQKPIFRVKICSLKRILALMRS